MTSTRSSFSSTTSAQADSGQSSPCTMKCNAFMSLRFWASMSAGNRLVSEASSVKRRL
jgi:hypothetical protein